MTKLLEEAIAEIRKLPDAEQDLAAEMLLSLVHRGEAEAYELTPEQIAQIETGLSQVRRREFADPEEIERIWRQFGL